MSHQEAELKSRGCRRRRPDKTAREAAINLLWPAAGDGEGSTCKAERL